MIRIDDLKTVSRAIIARLFKCTPTNVNKMVERGMPRRKDGKYDLFDVVGWRLDELALASAKDENKEAQKWLTRFRKARALREETAHAKERGALIESEVGAALIRQLISNLRAGLDTLAARLAGQLTGLSDRREVERIILVEIHALENILHNGNSYADESAAALVKECDGLTPWMKKHDETRQRSFGWPPFWSGTGGKENGKNGA